MHALCNYSLLTSKTYPEIIHYFTKRREKERTPEKGKEENEPICYFVTCFEFLFIILSEINTEEWFLHITNLEQLQFPGLLIKS
jgi:hypothetical protein